MKKKLPSLVVLCVIGLLAGLLLSLTNAVTSEPIAAVETSNAETARKSVLESAKSFEELELRESRYALDSVYEGRDDTGASVGYVGQATVTGFGGPIEVVAGVDMDGVITGISVGGSDFAETAGLGAKTKDAAFTDQFKGKTPTIVLNEDGVDTVTGASTSSRAVISGVNTIANYIYTYNLGLMEEATVYTGATTSLTTQGFGGEVTVNIGFADDGTIEYLSVDTPNETDGLGKMTSESSYTSQFLGKTGPFIYGEDGIEAVSGATVTSTAVLNAINEIVSGGGTASAEPVSTTVQCFGGEVTVTARLNADNSIAALSIDTPDETDGLGKTASESSFTDQFIGKMAPFTYGEDGIEAITGATVTSTAVINALNDIVPAGDKTAKAVEAEEPAEEAVEEPVEEEEQTEVVEEVPAELLALTAGEYTVTKETPFSKIDVTLTLSDDAITDAVITSEALEGQTDLLTDDSRKTLADEIIAAQGSDIDAVTGVTISSDAIKEAVDEILTEAKAGEEVPAEEEAPVEEDTSAEAGSTYTVTKETPFSKIDVTLTLSDDAITDAVITSEALEGQTDLLTDDSRKTLADAILAAQGSDIDAVSGVTISSDAIREAADEILEEAKAGEEVPAEEEAPVEEDTSAEAGSTYTVTKETPFSKIDVTLTLSDDAITDAVITSEAIEGQTDLLTDDSRKTLVDEIIAAQGSDIDAVSGVTISSDAIKEAVDEILTEAKAGEEVPAEEEAPVEEETSAEAGSTYTVTKETPFSKIDVTLTLSDDAITDAVITSEALEGQTDLLTDDSRKTLADAILAAQGSDIDAVSGVTISSDAIKEAVDEILEEAKAGEEVPAEEEAPVEEETSAEAGSTYTVTKETPFSKIDVTLTLSDDAITDAVITSEAIEGQTDLLTDDSRKTLADEIIAAQGSDIDAVTGVTISSDAIKEAVDEILEQAKAGESEGARFKAGEYSTDVETAFSTIAITLTFSDDAITEAVITSEALEGQTDLLTDDSRKTLADEIIAAQGSEIDAVSGVTISSEAIEEAVEALIQQAAA